MNLLGAQLVEKEERTIPVILRLTRFYEHLVKAGQEEWDAYAKVLNRTRVANLRESWPLIEQLEEGFKGFGDSSSENKKGT